MKIRDRAYIRDLGFAKTTAGWVVIRQELARGETDVVAGAFQTLRDAIEAARTLLNRELDDVAKELDGDGGLT